MVLWFCGLWFVVCGLWFVALLLFPVATGRVLHTILQASPRGARLVHLHAFVSMVPPATVEAHLCYDSL